MKVKVLQGLNMRADISVVEIEMDTIPNKKIMQLLKGYHPILLRNYAIEDNLLVIETKLPQIWKDNAKKLNDLANKHIDLEQAKLLILDNILKKHIGSMSTIIILEGAHKLGLETNRVFVSDAGSSNMDKSSSMSLYYRVGVGRHSGITIYAGTTKDSVIAKQIQRDKILSNNLVSRLNFKMAKWEEVKSEKQLTKVFERYQKPIVIKPTGLTQGKGVTTNIYNLDQAIKAYRYANKMIDEKDRQSWQKGVMIQEQVKGPDHRILVVNGQFELATIRLPAFVVGDGRSTIKILIEETNKDPRRDMQNPAHTLKPIQFDEPLHEFLNEQGLSLNTIPHKGEKVFVRKVASMSQGGITEDMTDKVHPHIKYFAESIASSIHANVVGIDIICQDISKPLTQQNGSFIEMNTRPEIYLNAFPVIGKQHPEIGEKIIHGLLSNLKPVKKIVVIGYELSQIKGYLHRVQALHPNNRVGILSDGVIYLNNEIMSDKINNISSAVKAIKMNASLTHIVLHYSSLESIKEYGFGFDNFDVLLTKDKDEVIDKYEKLGLIGSVETI